MIGKTSQQENSEHQFVVEEQHHREHTKVNDDIWYVPKDVYGESYWVDGISGLKLYTKPVVEQRGFVRLLRENDWMFVRNIPDLRDTAFRNW